MQYEPMLKARMSAFREKYSYAKISDDKLFELFVNEIILRYHQPDINSYENSLLSECSIGGADDMGIDGIIIKVNGTIVSTTRDIDELVELNKLLSIEFIFIQSKNKDKIDAGEYGKFTDGIIDFLSETHNEPHIDKIDALLQVKDYLFSDKIILRWRDNPTVRVYYVLFGNWRESKHFDAKTRKLEQDVQALHCYSNVAVNFIDNLVLKELCDENDNSFSAIMPVIDCFGLNDVEGVENSLVVLCNAVELIKIITTSDKMLRISLFTDNVRDYQGSTEINTEIMGTIQQAPSSFALLNNGITIVCSSVLVGNRKLTLSNPQIVNGCQTCNVLYDAYSREIDLSKVTLLIKIIATEKDDLTTAVIRGTNSQNVVYNEAFETTRDFHKDLESFVNVIQTQNTDFRIYYERRSRQYSRSTDIMPSQIAGLKTLTQSFVSVFMQSPHLGTSHEAILLKKYRNSIFADGQSFYPYYVALLMCLNYERVRHEGRLTRDMEGYKHHTLLIASEYIAGICPAINNSQKIDSYCQKLIETVSNIVVYEAAIKKSEKILQEAINQWIKRRGSKFRHGIKDNAGFTNFMLTMIRGGNLDKVDIEKTETIIYRGLVVKAKRDRNGFFYGFIQKSPDDVFFHERDNSSLDFDEIYGKTVLYRIFSDTFNGEDRAEIIEVLSAI